MAATNKDALLDAWTKGAKGRQSEPSALEGTGTAQKEPGDVLQWSLELLKAHPENEKYFNPLNDEMFLRLKNDIVQNGIHDALIVTEQNEKGERVILSGHNRFRAARELGLKTVPIREKIFSSSDETVKFMIRDNALRRHLKPEEIKTLISRIYAEEIQIDRRGGDRKSEKTSPEKSKVQSELLIIEKPKESGSLAQKVAKDFQISESAAKKHLAEIRKPKETRLKARQNAQESPGRTRKDNPGQSLSEAKKLTKAYFKELENRDLTGKEKQQIFEMIKDYFENLIT